MPILNRTREVIRMQIGKVVLFSTELFSGARNIPDNTDLFHHNSKSDMPKRLLEYIYEKTEKKDITRR